MSVTIRDLNQNDESRWRDLWAGYLAYYDKHDLDPAVTDNTWAMVSGERTDLFALVAERDGHVIGFANCLVHPNTWVDTPVCYLEDLFVDAEHRGQGAGEALVQAVLDRARAENWGRVYWRTHAANPARTLYERFTPVTDWRVYEINF